MKLILIRHGETTGDKTNPHRTLTARGVRAVRRVCQVLAPYIGGRIVVICSPTARAVQSASIIKNIVKADMRQAELYISGEDKIEELLKLEGAARADKVATYLSSHHHDSVGIEAPTSLTRRWENIFGVYGRTHDTVIAVSHGGALDAFTLHCKSFDLIKKSYQRYFDYADYVIGDLNTSHKL